jgi:hypothetical protein
MDRKEKVKEMNAKTVLEKNEYDKCTLPLD